MRIHHPLSPVFNRQARVLILGSMPGAASLQAKEYYAHPRNQFWDIMHALAGAGREHDYASRLKILMQNRIALWDVIASCERVGSLDASIKSRSVVIHSLADLVAQCPELKTICLNGKTAELYFRRHSLKRHPELHARYKILTLPSTSPANASLTCKEKIVIWKQLQSDLTPL